MLKKSHRDELQEWGDRAYPATMFALMLLIMLIGAIKGMSTDAAVEQQHLCWMLMLICAPFAISTSRAVFGAPTGAWQPGPQGAWQPGPQGDDPQTS